MMDENNFLDFFDEFEEVIHQEEEQVHTELILKTEPHLALSLNDHRDKDVAIYRLDLLRFIEKRLVGGWTPTHLTPLLEQYAVIKKIEVPTARTVANWKKAYLESGKDPSSLLPKHHRKGAVRVADNRGKLDTEHLVLEAIDRKYLIKERPSINTAYEYYRYRVLEENKNKHINLKPISQRTFYNRVNSLPLYDVALARLGRRYADSKYKTVGTQIPATRPMEFVEIDHSTAPVILLDDELELPLGRPHLTILYDRYSACIVGLSVNYRDPSYETVRAALLNVILKKDWVRQKYPSIESDWPCHGKITNLIVDNGAEFWSGSLESGLRPLVTNILYNQRGKPWHKPGVEKSFDTFYKKLFSRFPGKTFTNSVELKCPKTF